MFSDRRIPFFYENTSPWFADKREERKYYLMSEKVNVAEIFGSNVFNDAAMKERLPKAVYKLSLIHI